MCEKRKRKKVSETKKTTSAITYDELHRRTMQHIKDCNIVEAVRKIKDGEVI